MYLYPILTIVGAVLALAVAAAAVYTAIAGRRAGQQAAWSRWTVLDYVVCAMFTVGALLLLADVIALQRDRDGSAYYHYGYLMSAFVYMTMGMLYMVVRLGLLVQSPSRQASTPSTPSTSGSSPEFNIASRDNGAATRDATIHEAASATHETASTAKLD